VAYALLFVPVAGLKRAFVHLILVGVMVTARHPGVEAQVWDGTAKANQFGNLIADGLLVPVFPIRQCGGRVVEHVDSTSPISGDDLPLVETFRVGTSVNFVHGGGHLDVFPGRLVLEVGRVTQGLAGVAEVVHQDCKVHVTLTRLPLLMTTRVVLFGEGQPAIATVSRLHRASLLGALRRAGFDVQLHKKWVSLSDEIMSQAADDDDGLHGAAGPTT
jgi:hypothetical protein